MPQNRKILEQIGCTPKEAKVYLASLQLGEAHISDIAAKVKMPRSTVQTIAERLLKKGFMNFYIMQRYKYWVAERPKKLLEDFRKREELIREALPKFETMRKMSLGTKRQKQYSKKSIQAFRVFADASLQPVLITDADATIQYVNAAWEKQFGYLLAEVRGKNPRMFKSDKTPPSLYTRMWEALTADELFQTDQIIDTRKDGTSFNLVTTIFPLRHGTRTFYVQILTEITKKDA